MVIKAFSEEVSDLDAVLERGIGVFLVEKESAGFFEEEIGVLLVMEKVFFCLADERIHAFSGNEAQLFRSGWSRIGTVLGTGPSEL
jgi:hypothetical protein